MRQMPGAAEAMNGAAHDGKEDPSFIAGRLKEQAAFCGRQSHQVCAAPHLPAGILSPYSDGEGGALIDGFANHRALQNIR
jgi:hypothetical protein